MECYNISLPTAETVPIIVGSPHSGTYIPQHIRERMVPELVAKMDETDWFIDKLYDFVPAMGATLISANYSRWVIDLNRHPKQQPLYNDGRIITSLVPLTNFNGLPLYKEQVPDDEEIKQRTDQFYLPYHQKLESLMQQTVQQFGIALLLDAHSIRRLVPGIQKAPFPDIILSDNDQLAASKKISGAALDILKTGSFQIEYNRPFKGGHITRSFGRPKDNMHALQIEIVKSNYMDDTETAYHEERAGVLRHLLQQTFIHLINALS